MFMLWFMSWSRMYFQKERFFNIKTPTILKALGPTNHGPCTSWVNEDIEKLPAEEVEKCHKVTTCNITVTFPHHLNTFLLALRLFSSCQYFLPCLNTFVIVLYFHQTVDDTRTRQVPKRVCEDVQKRRRECKSVQRQQPPYVREVVSMPETICPDCRRCLQ